MTAAVPLSSCSSERRRHSEIALKRAIASSQVATCAFPLNSPRVPPGLQENVVDHFFRRQLVADHADDEAEDARIMTQIKQFERTLVAIDHQPNQVPV